MTGLKTSLGWLFAGAAILAPAVSAAPAAPPKKAAAPPAQLADETAAMVRPLHTELSRAFRLPEALPLDADLRREAESLAAAHLERMQKLLPVWIDEERRLQGAGGAQPRPDTVFHAVYARMLNELALWQIEPGDAAYEKATLEVLKNSSVACWIEGDRRYNDYETRITRLQAMPPAQRQAALANERRLLEQWGKPRPALPAWPDPLPRDGAMAAVGRMRDGGERPPEALPPALASNLLAKRESHDELAWQSRCNLARWWLRVSLKQGATPEAALSAFRYGMLITAMDRYGKAMEGQSEAVSKAAAASVPGYPPLAARFDVTGTTRVRRRIDAAGKPVEASVVERRIAVRGIRGVRPVAFETTFDAPSIRYALQGAAAGAPLPPEFEMKWTLDPQEGSKP